MNTARAGLNAMPLLCSEAAAMTGAWRSALASLLCRNGLISGFEMLGQNLESLPPLPKDHSQSAQDLVKNSTLNPGTGGSNEKAISRKRSAGRVGLSGAGGIRCRKGGAGIYTTAAAGSGLHLERLLCWCERGHFVRNQPTFHHCGIHFYWSARRARARRQHYRLLQPVRLHRRGADRVEMAGGGGGLWRRRGGGPAP